MSQYSLEVYAVWGYSKYAGLDKSCKLERNRLSTKMDRHTFKLNVKQFWNQAVLDHGQNA